MVVETRGTARKRLLESQANAHIRDEQRRRLQSAPQAQVAAHREAPNPRQTGPQMQYGPGPSHAVVGPEARDAAGQRRLDLPRPSQQQPQALPQPPGQPPAPQPQGPPPAEEGARALAIAVPELANAQLDVRLNEEQLVALRRHAHVLDEIASVLFHEGQRDLAFQLQRVRAAVRGSQDEFEQALQATLQAVKHLRPVNAVRSIYREVLWRCTPVACFGVA